MPTELSPWTYRGDLLTSAAICDSGGVILCPEHVVGACMLVGLRDICITLVAGPAEFPIGPKDGSYVELLLESIGSRGPVPMGPSVTSAISVVDDDGELFTAEPSERASLTVSWSLAEDSAATSATIGVFPSVEEILSIGRSRSFVLAKDVDRLRVQGRLLGISDAADCVRLGTVDEFRSSEHARENAEHKLYDLLGDLGPLGGLPAGASRAFNPGHRRNARIRSRFTAGLC